MDELTREEMELIDGVKWLYFGDEQLLRALVRENELMRLFLCTPAIFSSLILFLVVR